MFGKVQLRFPEDPCVILSQEMWMNFLRRVREVEAVLWDGHQGHSTGIPRMTQRLNLA